MASTEANIRRAINGDTQAITDLYQAFAPAIYRYIAYRVPTDTDAEDLTAEVFLKMVEGLPNYRLTGVPFEAWLYRIAAARIADFYRKRGTSAELDDQLTDHLPPPEDQIQQREEVDELREMFRQFSEEDQSILILRFVERKSHKEVASLLGKTVSAVKSAQHRALVQLSSLMGSAAKTRHYLRGHHE